MSILELRNVEKIYGEKDNQVKALRNINLKVEEGEFVAIVGTSGSGKSTCLNLIGGLDNPTSGQIFIKNKEIGSLSRKELTIFRRRNIGFVFQNYSLMPVLNVYDNVALPVTFDCGKHINRKYIEELLRELGIWEKRKKYPNELSGGQQQRIAIARALATNPKVLLCDEATSALDPKTTRQILELIGDINKKLGITVVIITHQMSVVKEVCNHVAILDDGEVVEEGLVSTVFSAPKSAAARHLVFPRGADIDVSDPQQQRRIRLIFRSAKTTSIPLVARLATDEGISATVISANTQKLSEEVYGSMLLGVPNAQFEQAMDFLRGIENLQVEEASVDVQ